MADMSTKSGNRPYRIDPEARTNPFYGYVVPVPWPYFEQDQLRPQFGQTRSKRELARNTTPCWHFVKNDGECPRGQFCAFVHDMELQKALERDREEERKATGTEKASHCWAYAQGRCRLPDCTYLHPQDIGPYIPYTPCVNWSFCSQAPYCPFQHPDRLILDERVLMQRQYIGQLATVSGTPITFNGTTFFPMLDARIDRGIEGSVEFGRECHAHRSRTASSCAFRNEECVIGK
ncbi:hypothetical protein F5887DRAFT_933859 [Amanita rubescens]|nr:hypothetical protein F5887DRAFT_933859 [Amanita rubescens]